MAWTSTRSPSASSGPSPSTTVVTSSCSISKGAVNSISGSIEVSSDTVTSVTSGTSSSISSGVQPVTAKAVTNVSEPRTRPARLRVNFRTKKPSSSKQRRNAFVVCRKWITTSHSTGWRCIKTQMHPIHRIFQSALLRIPHKISPKLRSRGMRRLFNCTHSLRLGCQTLDSTSLFQALKNPALLRQIVIRQIQPREPRITPLGSCALPVAFKEPMFNDPVQFGTYRIEIIVYDGSYSAFPQIKNFQIFGAAAFFCDKSARFFREALLQRQGRGCAARC